MWDHILCGRRGHTQSFIRLAFKNWNSIKLSTKFLNSCKFEKFNKRILRQITSCDLAEFFGQFIEAMFLQDFFFQFFITENESKVYIAIWRNFLDKCSDHRSLLFRTLHVTPFCRSKSLRNLPFQVNCTLLAKSKPTYFLHGVFVEFRILMSGSGFESGSGMSIWYDHARTQKTRGIGSARCPLKQESVQETKFRNPFVDTWAYQWLESQRR